MRDWNTISSAYRPLEGDVLHPDECVVIRIMGAEWRVRPLQLPKGIMFTPEFGDVVTLNQTVDPLGNKPMQDRAEELVAFLASEQDDQLIKITAVCAYLGELLDQQYDLSDEVKSDLLKFRGVAIPAWYQQAVRHANGLPPVPTTAEFISSLENEPEIENNEEPNKPFWKFW